MIGSGNFPPFFRYRLFTRKKSSFMMSESGLDWPMGSMALYLHCAKRPELDRLPSFSTDDAAGSMKTSVWISFGFMPGPLQNDPVSLSKRFTFTIHLSLASACLTFPALAPEQAGFWPHAKKPSNLPWLIWSK